MTKAEVEALKVIEGCSNWSDIQHRILPRVTAVCEQRQQLLEELQLAVDWMRGKRGGPSEGLLAAHVITRLENALSTIDQKGSGSE